MTQKQSLRELAEPLTGTQFAFLYSTHPTPTQPSYVFQHITVHTEEAAREVINTALAALRELVAPTSGTISDAQARTIASQWHGGQASGLYSFTSTGVVDRVVVAEVVAELSAALEAAALDDTNIELQDNARDLRALAKYVISVGRRTTPVPGWSKLHDSTAPTSAQS